MARYAKLNLYVKSQRSARPILESVFRVSDDTTDQEIACLVSAFMEQQLWTEWKEIDEDEVNQNDRVWDCTG